MEQKLKQPIFKLIPVLFSFFVMGFVDVVSISTSYVKQDFELSDSIANLLPMMVFVWFAVCSIPVGIMMRKYGRKNTVLLSGVITTIAMLIPFIGYTYPLVMLAFAMLGIGNTILQVSLNPLMTNVTTKDKITSMLTLGQFIKAIASAAGPLLVGFFAVQMGNWKLIFPLYAVVTALSIIWLWSIRIDEQRNDSQTQVKGASIIFSLLKDKFLLTMFSIIALIVGFEVGLMTTVPKYLDQSYGFALEIGGYACTIYFIARTIGTFTGAIVLSRINIKKFFVWTMLAAIISLVWFMTIGNMISLMISLFCVGLTCANVFPIAFSEAIQYKPEYADEISALMIVGVSGGALLPPIIGVVADYSTQQISIIVPLLALVYIFICAIKLSKK